MFLRATCIAVLLAVAIASASGQEPQTQLEYSNYVYSKVLEHRRYPAAARADQLEGTVVIKFRVFPDGTIGSRAVVTSSGHQILDEEALAIVDRVKRFPPFPPEMETRSGVTYQVPIMFCVKAGSCVDLSS